MNHRPPGGLRLGPRSPQLRGPMDASRLYLHSPAHDLRQHSTPAAAGGGFLYTPMGHSSPFQSPNSGGPPLELKQPPQPPRYNSSSFQGAGSNSHFLPQPPRIHALGSPLHQQRTHPLMAIHQQPLPAVISPTALDPSKSSRSSGEGATSSSAQSQQQPLLTNMKEKNSMCQINDLIKYNRMTHRYVLTNESGPAHAKIFNVTLTLGESESYTASGPSIKKAQHAAASKALEQTKLKRPPQRHVRRKNGIVTPTVELNALATQKGIQVEYHVTKDPPSWISIPVDQGGAKDNTGGGTFTAIARLLGKDYIGVAKSAQAAKHRAATKALEEFKLMPDEQKERLEVPLDNPDALGGEGKSPISQIFELALKRDYAPVFEVVQETGPPHLKTFITKLKCGDHETSGDGNSKKLSKKRAAEKMLDHLATLAPLPPELNNPSSAKVYKKGKDGKAAQASAPQKKRGRNLVKDPKAYPEYGKNIHPVSRLIQVTQARHEKEPVYTLVAEKGLPRHREFTIQVTVGEHTCMGTGPKKKAAKRAAAEQLLDLMGYSKPGAFPEKGVLRSNGTGAEGDKKVTFDSGQEGAKKPVKAGRQIAPGLLLLGKMNTTKNNSPTPPLSPAGALSPSSSPVEGDEKQAEDSGNEQSATTEQRTCILIARELLEHGKSETAEKLKASNKTAPLSSAKEKLIYLSEVTGLALDFTTFPLAKNAEHVNMAYLALSSQPLVATGKGPTLIDSQEAASYGALKILSSMDLEDEEDADKK